jgi:spore coat protein CotF
MCAILSDEKHKENNIIYYKNILAELSEKELDSSKQLSMLDKLAEWLNYEEIKNSKIKK